MPPIPHRVRVRRHPGSSKNDINNEPDWAAGHLNRIGYRNLQDRFPGLTHAGDEREDLTEFEQRALKEREELKSRIQQGDLVNFRDVITRQEVKLTHIFPRYSTFEKSNKGRNFVGLPSAPARCPFGWMAIRA